VPALPVADIYGRHYAVYDRLYGDLKTRFSEIAALAVS